MAMQLIYRDTPPGQGIAYAWWQSMHSRVDIIVHGYPEAVIKPLFTEAEQELNRLEKIGNFYNTRSELHEVNQTAAQAPVRISNELFEMIRNCIGYYTATQGYFDISFRSGKHPEPAISSIQLSEEDRTVAFCREDIKLDLSGYLKGYGLDRIRQMFADAGILNALINMGNSSALALGNHPHGEGWKITFGTEPADGSPEVCLFNECLTTSGNATASRKHIVNPATGEYVGGKKQISVITPTGVDGEVLSTALFAAPADVHDAILANFINSRKIPD